MSINIQECNTCLSRYFPQRLICRTCSSSDLSTVAVGQGRVEERTTLSNRCVLATIRIGEDLRVMARVHPEAQLDEVVELTDCESVEPGQAYVPTRRLPQ